MANKMAHAKLTRKMPPAKPRGLPMETLLMGYLRDVSAGKLQHMRPSELRQNFGKRFAALELEELVIPHRTMARRLAKKESLTQEETDKAVRLARVVREADRVFGNAGKADRWLRSPLKRLSNQTPLELLKSEAGAMLVEEVLGQIDHGMFA